FFFDRVHPEDRKRVRDLFEKCVGEKRDFQAEARLLLPDGTIKHRYAIGRPVVNEAGELVEFVGAGIDTTEQMEARIQLEGALREITRLKDELYHENIALREEIDHSSMFEEIVVASK